MGFECLHGITRAGRGEPTRRWAVLGLTLVPVDGPDQLAVEVRALDMIVLTNRSRSNESSPNDRWAPAGVTPTRYKPAGRSVHLLCTRARSRRRTRLRVTAGPTARPIAYATIGDDARGSSTNVHHRTPARAREPVRAKRSNEARPLQRPIKLTDGAGPWHAELSRRLGHL